MTAGACLWGTGGHRPAVGEHCLSELVPATWVGGRKRVPPGRVLVVRSTESWEQPPGQPGHEVRADALPGRAYSAEAMALLPLSQRLTAEHLASYPLPGRRPEDLHDAVVEAIKMGVSPSVIRDALSTPLISGGAEITAFWLRLVEAEMAAIAQKYSGTPPKENHADHHQDR